MAEACPQPARVNSCYVTSLLLERQTSHYHEQHKEAPSAVSLSSVYSQLGHLEMVQIVQLRTRAIVAHT